MQYCPLGIVRWAWSNKCNTSKPLNQNGGSQVVLFWSPRETKYRSQIWSGEVHDRHPRNGWISPTSPYSKVISATNKSHCPPGHDAWALLLRVRPSGPSSFITLVLGLGTQIRSEY